MRIEADLGCCVGAGMCALTAADVFDQDPSDGHVLVLVEHPTADRLDVVRQAVASCPSGALSLREDPA